MKKILTISMLLGAGLFVGCATTTVAKDPERLSIIKGQTHEGTVGFNEKGEVVIESEKNAVTELTILRFVNEDLTYNLKEESRRLNDCRMDLADPANGGDGEISEIPEVDNLRTPEQEKSSLLLHGADDQITIVKSKSFVDTLKNEQTYETSLRAMLKVVGKHRTKCEFNLRIQHAKMQKEQGDTTVARVHNAIPYESLEEIQRKKNDAILDRAEASLKSAGNWKGN